MADRKAQKNIKIVLQGGQKVLFSEDDLPKVVTAINNIKAAFEQASTAKDAFATNVKTKSDQMATDLQKVATQAGATAQAVEDAAERIAKVSKTPSAASGTGGTAGSSSGGQRKPRTQKTDPVAARMTSGHTGDYGMAAGMSGKGKPPPYVPANFGGPPDSVLRERGRYRLAELRKFKVNYALEAGDNPPVGGGGFLPGTGQTLGGVRRSLGGESLTRFSKYSFDHVRNSELQAQAKRTKAAKDEAWLQAEITKEQAKADAAKLKAANDAAAAAKEAGRRQAAANEPRRLQQKLFAMESANPSGRNDPSSPSVGGFSGSPSSIQGQATPTRKALPTAEKQAEAARIAKAKADEEFAKQWIASSASDAKKQEADYAKSQKAVADAEKKKSDAAKKFADDWIKSAEADRKKQEADSKKAADASAKAQAAKAAADKKFADDWIREQQENAKKQAKDQKDAQKAAQAANSTATASQGGYGPFLNATQRAKINAQNAAANPGNPVQSSRFGDRQDAYDDAVQKIRKGKGLYEVSQDLTSTHVEAAFDDADKLVRGDIKDALKRRSSAKKDLKSATASGDTKAVKAAEEKTAIAKEDVDILLVRRNQNKQFSEQVRKTDEAYLNALVARNKALAKFNSESNPILKKKAEFELQTKQKQLDQAHREKQAVRNPNAASKGFGGQNLTFAAQQAAYGVEDFFQVLAAGQSPVRAFLGAANNIGPALALVGVSGVAASIGIAGLLAVTSVFGRDGSKAKKVTDDWNESLDRLSVGLKAVAGLQAELANSSAKLRSGVFSTSAADALSALSQDKDISSTGKRLQLQGLGPKSMSVAAERNEKFFAKSMQWISNAAEEAGDYIHHQFRSPQIREERNEVDKYKTHTFEELESRTDRSKEKKKSGVIRQFLFPMIPGSSDEEEADRRVLDAQAREANNPQRKAMLDEIAKSDAEKQQAESVRSMLKGESQRIREGFKSAGEMEKQYGLNGLQSQFASQNAKALPGVTQKRIEAEKSLESFRANEMANSSFTGAKSRVNKAMETISEIERNKAIPKGREKDFQDKTTGKRMSWQGAIDKIKNDIQNDEMVIRNIELAEQKKKIAIEGLKEYEEAITGAGEAAIETAKHLRLASKESEYNSYLKQSERGARGGRGENMLFGGVTGRELNMRDALNTLAEDLDLEIAKAIANNVNAEDQAKAVANVRTKFDRERQNIQLQGGGIQFDERGTIRKIDEITTAWIKSIEKNVGNAEALAAVGEQARNQILQLKTGDAVSQARQYLNEFSDTLETVSTRISNIFGAESKATDYERGFLAAGLAAKSFGFEMKALPDRLGELDKRFKEFSETIKKINDSKLPEKEKQRLLKQAELQRDVQAKQERFNDPVEQARRASRGGYSDKLSYQTSEGRKTGKQMNFEAQLKTMREEESMKQAEIKGKGGTESDLAEMESSFQRRVAALMDQSFGLSEKKQTQIMPVESMWNKIQESLSTDDPSLKIEQSQLDMLKRIHDALMKGDKSKLTPEERRKADKLTGGEGVPLVGAGRGGMFGGRFSRKKPETIKKGGLKKAEDIPKKEWWEELSLEEIDNELARQEEDRLAQEEFAPNMSRPNPLKANRRVQGLVGDEFNWPDGEDGLGKPSRDVGMIGDFGEKGFGISIKDSLDQSKVLGDILRTLNEKLGASIGIEQQIVGAIQNMETGGLI